ncbi:MAG: class I poly(R)-hydroxyalkanoic acid synthase, partial [Sphingomonas sp.]
MNPGTTIASGTAAPTLAELQHWTWVMGRAQQMMMAQGLDAITAPLDAAVPEAMVVPGFNDPATIARVRDFWRDGFALWQ